jgi:hypothetical protein
MSKIFVRHRHHVGQGAGRPRFALVAVEGADLTVFKTRLRRAELEKIASDIGAEIIYLPRGEHAGEVNPAEDAGQGRRHRRDRTRTRLISCLTSKRRTFANIVHPAIAGRHRQVCASICLMTT